MCLVAQNESTGRCTSKASVAAAHSFPIALCVFLSGGLILTPVLSMATDTHRRLAECGFQWSWFYKGSPLITALEMTQLFWNECAEWPWQSHGERRGPPTCQLPGPSSRLQHLAELVELRSPGFAAKIAGAPRRGWLNGMACDDSVNVQVKG